MSNDSSASLHRQKLESRRNLALQRQQDRRAINLESCSDLISEESSLAYLYESKTKKDRKDRKKSEKSTSKRSSRSKEGKEKTKRDKSENNKYREDINDKFSLLDIVSSDENPNSLTYKITADASAKPQKLESSKLELNIKLFDSKEVQQTAVVKKSDTNLGGKSSSISTPRIKAEDLILFSDGSSESNCISMNRAGCQSSLSNDIADLSAHTPRKRAVHLTKSQKNQSESNQKDTKEGNNSRHLHSKHSITRIYEKIAVVTPSNHDLSGITDLKHGFAPGFVCKMMLQNSVFDKNREFQF